MMKLKVGEKLKSSKRCLDEYSKVADPTVKKNTELIGLINCNRAIYRIFHKTADGFEDQQRQQNT